jgi:sortase (surface protein transpeptidase)
MGLIRFLIIAICSLYIIRSLVRIFLPMLFNSVINKAQEQARQQQQNYQQQQQRPDGRIRVDYKPEGKKSQVPDSEGEFVDYEEIK